MKRRDLSQCTNQKTPFYNKRSAWVLVTAFILLTVMILMLVACDNQQSVPVSGVELSQTSAELEVGDSLQLTATVLPSNATDKTVTWLSSAPSIASVENGLVTAVSAGSANITVMTRDGLFSAPCAVTVSNAQVGTVRVTGVALNTNELDLTVDGTAALTASVLPAGATEQAVTWVSSIPEVVSVHNGVLTARTNGVAAITVTTVDGGYTDTCVVTVKEQAPETVAVTGVTLNQTALQMHPGDEAALTAAVQPLNATNQAVTWSSSAPEVAAVTNGVVRAVTPGNAVITVTTADGGYTDTCVVTVKEQTPETVAVTGVTLNQTALQMHPGDEAALTAKVQPLNATNQAVTWSSSAPGVAAVTNGVVRAVTPGVAFITVTTADGGYTAVCSVIVTQPAATGVKLDKTSLVLGKNETAQLTATLLPENAIPQMVLFQSQDPTVAAVDAEGIVTAVGKGETVVRAYLTNSIYAECTVRVGYRLTIAIEGEGTVDGNSLNALKFQGDYCSVAAKPGFGMIFSGWFEGDTRVSDTARYYFDMPANDYTLTVKFTDDPKMPDCVNGVYQIATQDNLIWATQNQTLSYLLLNDIAAPQDAAFIKFTGVFDGGGHTITGYAGKMLFDVIEGTVQNLTLSNVTISADVSENNGLFANTANNATLTNCHVTGTLTETSSFNMSGACAGGLLGYASSTVITGCSATVTLNALSSNTGGLVGKALNCTIANSFARADTVWSRVNNSYVGGFIGAAAGSTVISDCSAGGSIAIQYSETSVYYECLAAGFAAINSGTVQSCLSNVNISAYRVHNQSVFAGFCAENNGKIARSLALGSVSSDNANTDLYTFVSSTGINELTFVKASEFFAGVSGFATYEMLGRTSFYQDTLLFNADAWAYAPGKLPALQGDIAAQLPDMVCAPGSLGNPIPVSTAEELQAIDMEKSYYLTGDIDFAGKTLNPLGLVNTTATPYRGNFDGRNFVIRNVNQDLNIYSNGTLYGGVFAAISGSVVNLRLENYAAKFEASSKGYFGALAGSVLGRVENCRVNGSIDLRHAASDRVCLGGLTGEASGMIQNCGSNVTMKVVKNGNERMAVGGLIGNAKGITQNCYAAGDITFSGTTSYYSSVYRVYAGGFFGEAGFGISDKATFINCYASGNLYTDHVYAFAGAFGGTANDRDSVNFQSCAAFGNVSVDLARPQGGGMDYFVYLPGTGVTEHIFVYEGQIFTDLSDNTVRQLFTAYSKATAEECNSSAYWESMGWSANVWDFNNLDVANKVLPVLK